MDDAEKYAHHTTINTTGPIKDAKDAMLQRQADTIYDLQRRNAELANDIIKAKGNCDDAIGMNAKFFGLYNSVCEIVEQIKSAKESEGE